MPLKWHFTKGQGGRLLDVYMAYAVHICALSIISLKSQSKSGIVCLYMYLLTKVMNVLFKYNGNFTWFTGALSMCRWLKTSNFGAHAYNKNVSLEIPAFGTSCGWACTRQNLHNHGKFWVCRQQYDVLSHDVMSGNDMMQCNKINKSLCLVVYRFSNIMVWHLL